MAITKNAKGFTLVELMIVISIIGVLAVTLMPVLTGAQARSRDAGRLASINNIAAALATYNSDTGKYPLASGGGHANGDTGTSKCISDAAGVTADDLAPLIKGSKMPVDPQIQNISGACALAGAYGYEPLTKDAVTQGGYYLVANMETLQKTNFDWNNYASIGGSANTMSTYLSGALTAEPSGGASKSVYVIIN